MKCSDCSATWRNLCGKVESRDLVDSATCDRSSGNVHIYADTRDKRQERAQVRAVKMNPYTEQWRKFETRKKSGK